MKYQGIIIIRRITIIGPNNIISIMVGVLRNNTKNPGEKHRVTSESCTPGAARILRKVLDSGWCNEEGEC